MEVTKYFTTMNGVRLALVSMFLILSVAFLVMPVAAVESQPLIIYASNPAVFSFSVIPSEMYMSLHVGDNELTTGTPVCNISGNSPNWYISARDDQPQVYDYSTPVFGPGDPAGRMKLFSDSSAPMAKTLATPMQIGVGSGAYQSLSATNTQIMSSTIAGSPQYNANLKFKQVVLGNDAPSPTGSKYRLVTVIVGESTL